MRDQAMRREPSSPLTRLIPLPLWAVIVAPLSLAVVAGIVGLASGVFIGRSGGKPNVLPVVETKPATKADPKAYLRDPIDKKAFEQAVMGKSTREITEMLGPPKWVLNNPDVGLGWSYPMNLSPDGKKWTSHVILMIRNDHVTEITW